jgi:hypothetical protein
MIAVFRQGNMAFSSKKIFANTLTCSASWSVLLFRNIGINFTCQHFRTSFPLWETGIFLWTSNQLCRCRSPPHFGSPVNWTCEPKWRYIMQKINLRELYPDIYKKDTYLEVTDEVQAVFLADKRAEARYLR